MSQTDLAGKVGISYAQVSRYETKGAQPPAEVLSKLAQTLNPSVDFIIHGNAHEKATATLNDAKLINYFKEVEKMPEEEKIPYSKCWPPLFTNTKHNRFLQCKKPGCYTRLNFIACIYCNSNTCYEPGGSPAQE